jgi:hypothetical protein
MNKITFKPGFYYRNDERHESCVYLSGEKKGNKWIPIRTIAWNDEANANVSTLVPGARWTTLSWMCIKSAIEDMPGYTYHETNPTKFEL